MHAPLRLLSSAAAAAVTVVVAGVGLAAPAAAEQPDGHLDATVPLAELTVSLTGPETVAPGGAGTWVVAVQSTGSVDASDVRVTLVLPQHLQVAPGADSGGWSCTSTPFTCELDAALPGGATAPDLPVEVTFADDAPSGTVELAAVAAQGEGTSAVRYDRGTATVRVEEPAETGAETVPPAELAVSLTGPGAIGGGLRGTWAVGVSNTGPAAAPRIRVTLQLPDGVEATAVADVPGWSTCVLAPLSCELEPGLASGAAAPELPVDLVFDRLAGGTYELAAVAAQGEGTGAVRYDRGVTSVVVEPAAEPPAAAPEQPAAGDAVAGPAAHRPATTGATTGATTAAAPAAVAPAGEATPAVDAPATGASATQAEPAPEALPFADVPAPAGRPAVRAAGRSQDDGGSGALLATLALVALVTTVGAVGGRSALRRRAAG